MGVVTSCGEEWTEEEETKEEKETFWLELDVSSTNTVRTRCKF